MNSTVTKTILSLVLAILMVCAAVPALAKVTAEEAAKLKTELTPMGGERAGNEEGTIPAWTGGISKIPDGIDYVAKSGLPHPDPFAADKILFTITAQNVDQYKDKLSPGIVKLFKLYPETWKMHVYPTRRSAAYPKEHYQSTYQNALNTEVVDEYGSVINVGKGFPFPIAKSGAEAMINYILRPHGAKVITSTLSGAIVYPNGGYKEMGARQYMLYKLESASNEPVDIYDFVYGSVLETVMVGHAGEIYLMMDPANYSKKDALSYSYVPGMRRVRRNPNMNYDGIDGTGGGIACMDDGWMFRGKLDRFDWKLKGKKEMFIPYNCYQIDLLPEVYPIMTPHHPNPEYIRWELHRAWENVATLKEGARHMYGKRVFYQDEDTWVIGLKDNYDRRGTLWRTSFACAKQYYDIPVFRNTQYTNFDLQVDYYVINMTINGLPPESFEELPEDFFTVHNLRALGRQ